MDEKSSFWQLYSQKTCMLYASIYSDWCCINILWLDSDDSGGGSDDGNDNGARVYDDGGVDDANDDDDDDDDDGARVII